MAQQVLSTTEEWRALARQDPLYAVAAWPGKEGGGWQKEDFYAVGRSDWTDFRTRWRSYWPEIGGVAVDYGCGAGRITHAMADDFEEVVGVDVSAEMAALAREASASNVRVELVDTVEISLAAASVDAVFTSHVLQHLEDEASVGQVFAEAARVLRPGGSVMAHLLLASSGQALRTRVLAERALRRARRARRRGEADWTCRVRAYTRESARALVEGAGFELVELHEFRVRSNDDPHAFWLGRKPA